MYDLQVYLENLVEVDQKRLADLERNLKSANSLHEKLSKIKPVAKQCQITAEEMLDKLLSSGTPPTFSNVGSKASNAVILIALHSYIDIMRKISKLFHDIARHNKHDIPIQYLAVLDDRITIIAHKTQVNGTTTYKSHDREYFIPIKDIQRMQKNRQFYDLPPLDTATIKQKLMTKEEYLLNFSFMDKKTQ